MKKTVFTSDAPAPLHNLYSQAISVQGRLIFTAGQLGISPQTGTLVEGGVQAQTQQALENIKAIVKAAGSSMANIVKMTVLLANIVKMTVLLDSIDDFAAMNQVYKRYFTESPPARTAFEAARLPIGALVEIEAIAVVD